MQETKKHSACCHEPEPVVQTTSSCCAPKKKRPDIMLWGCLLAISILYLYYLAFADEFSSGWLSTLSSSVYDLVNTIWWGILLGFMMVVILAAIPKTFVMSVLGTQSGPRGIIRATLAGVLLDLCSHGILLVAARLYERGASTGQVMAFLIASPWNSFSLTLVLISMIGFGWTGLFIVLSMLVAITTGLLFDLLVARSVIPENKHTIDLPEDFAFFKEAKRAFKNAEFTLPKIGELLVNGIKESRMVIRWIFFGILLAALVRMLMEPEMFSQYFGPTLAGLGLTIIAATVIEVCSEGSAPLGADILTRGNAPGNSFAFLMTGVSTDYTEIMVMKETTGKWLTALLLPILTVPQVVLMAWVINLTAS